MLGDRIPAIRAERLRVALDLACGMPTLTAEEAGASTLLSDWSKTVAQGINEEDLALASAALTLEAELREKAWAALERLGALVAGSEGPLDRRVLALERSRFVGAACSLLTLGWVS